MSSSLFLSSFHRFSSVQVVTVAPPQWIEPWIVPVHHTSSRSFGRHRVPIFFLIRSLLSLRRAAQSSSHGSRAPWPCFPVSRRVVASPPKESSPSCSSALSTAFRAGRRLLLSPSSFRAVALLGALPLAVASQDPAGPEPAKPQNRC
jgi:hypothetical protein